MPGRAAAARWRASCARRSPGFTVTVAHSRWTHDPVDLYRAGKEALLAVNVAEAEGLETARLRGHRRLPAAAAGDERGPGRARALLRGDGGAARRPTTSSTRPSWWRRSRRTCDNDGNVTPTAEQLFTHRHTIRYRLERVKELSGHDITSTEGREKLGLGLKAMRVLGHRAAARPGDGARHRGRRAR